MVLIVPQLDLEAELFIVLMNYFFCIILYVLAIAMSYSRDQKTSFNTKTSKKISFFKKEGFSTFGCRIS